MRQDTLHRLRFERDHAWVPRHASDYLDGDLRPWQVIRVQRHIEVCPECRELLRCLREIVSGLGIMGAEPGEPVAGTIAALLQARLSDLPPADR